jgi:hypothetical protein
VEVFELSGLYILVLAWGGCGGAFGCSDMEKGWDCYKMHVKWTGCGSLEEED